MTIMAERPIADFARSLLVMLSSTKSRRVKTPEGAELYGQPIGTIITPDMLKPSVKSLAQMKNFPAGTRVTQTSSKGKETHYTKQKDGTWKSSATGAYGPAGMLGPAIVSGQLSVTKMPGEIVDEEDFDNDPGGDEGAPESPAAPGEAPASGTPAEGTGKPLGILELIDMPAGSRIAVTNEQGTAHFTKGDDGNWTVDGAVEGSTGHHSTAFKKYTDSGSVKVAGAQPGTEAAAKKAEAALDVQEKKAVEAAPGEPKVLKGQILDGKDLSAAPAGMKMYRTNDDGSVDEFTKVEDNDAWKAQGGSFLYGSSVFKNDAQSGKLSWDSPDEQKKEAPKAETIADDGSEPIPSGVIQSVADLDSADPGTKINNVSGTSEFVKQENGNWKSTATKKERPSSYFEPAIKNGAMEFSAPKGEKKETKPQEAVKPAPEDTAGPKLEDVQSFFEPKADSDAEKPAEKSADVAAKSEEPAPKKAESKYKVGDQFTNAKELDSLPVGTGVSGSFDLVYPGEKAYSSKYEAFGNYYKQANGDWKRQGSSKTVTTDELVAALKAAYASSEAKHKESLELGEGGKKKIPYPEPSNLKYQIIGSGDDIKPGFYAHQGQYGKASGAGSFAYVEVLEDGTGVYVAKSGHETPLTPEQVVKKFAGGMQQHMTPDQLGALKEAAKKAMESKVAAEAAEDAKYADPDNLIPVNVDDLEKKKVGDYINNGAGMSWKKVQEANPKSMAENVWLGSDGMHYFDNDFYNFDDDANEVGSVSLYEGQLKNAKVTKPHGIQGTIKPGEGFVDSGAVSSAAELDASLAGQKIYDVEENKSWVKLKSGNKWKLEGSKDAAIDSVALAKMIADGKLQFGALPLKGPKAKAVKELDKLKRGSKIKIPAPGKKNGVTYTKNENDLWEGPGGSWDSQWVLGLGADDAEYTLAFDAGQKPVAGEAIKAEAQLLHAPQGTVISAGYNGLHIKEGALWFPVEKSEDGTWKRTSDKGKGSFSVLSYDLDGATWKDVPDTEMVSEYQHANIKEGFGSKDYAELENVPAGTIIKNFHGGKGSGTSYKKLPSGKWMNLDKKPDDPTKIFSTTPEKMGDAYGSMFHVNVIGGPKVASAKKPYTDDEPDDGTPAEPAPDAPEDSGGSSASPAAPAPAEAPASPQDAPESPSVPAASEEKPVTENKADAEQYPAPVGPYTGKLAVGNKIADELFANFIDLPAGSKVEGLNGSTLTRQADGSWKHDRTNKSFSSKNLFVNGGSTYKVHSIGDGVVDEPIPASMETGQPQTQQEYFDLPVGTTFTTPNGTVWTKHSSDSWSSSNGNAYHQEALAWDKQTYVLPEKPVEEPAKTPMQQADDVLNFAMEQSAKSDLPPNGFNKKKYKAGSKITVSFTNDWGSKTTKTLTLQENGKWVQKNEGKKDNVWSAEFIEGRDDATITEHHVEYADGWEPPKSTEMAQSKPHWWENGAAVPSTLKQLDELPAGSVIHDNYDDPYIKQENGKWKNPQGVNVPTSVFDTDVFNGQVALVSLGEGNSVKKVTVHQGLDKGVYDVPVGSKVYHLKSTTSEAANTKYIVKPDGSWWKASQGELEFKGHPWITGENSLEKGFFKEDVPDPNFVPVKNPTEAYTQEEFDTLPIGTKVSWVNAMGSKATYTKINGSDYWQEDGTGNSLYMPTEVYIGYVYPYSPETQVVSKTKTITAGPHEHKIPQAAKAYYMSGADNKFVNNGDGSWTIYFSGGTVQHVIPDEGNNYAAIKAYNDSVHDGSFIPVGEMPKSAPAPEVVPNAPEPVAQGGINAVIFKDKVGTTHYAPAGTKLYEVPTVGYKYAEFPDGTWKQYKGEAEGPITLDATTIEILKKLIADGDTVQPVNAVPEKLHPSGLKPGKYTKIGGHGKVFMLVNADGTAAYIDKNGDAKPLGTKGVLGYHNNGFTNWTPHTGEAIPIPGANTGGPKAAKTPKAAKGSLPDYSAGGEFPNPFSKPPDTGYSPSVHELTAQIVRLAEESGFKNIAGLHRSGMSVQDKKDWAEAWYAGEWDKAYKIELAAAAKNNKAAQVGSLQELYDAPEGATFVKFNGKYKYEYTKGADGQWRRYSHSSYGDSSDEIWNYGGGSSGNLIWPDKVVHAKATQHPGSPDNPLNKDGFKPIVIGPAVAGEKMPGSLPELIPPGSYAHSMAIEDIDAYMVAAGMQNAHGLSDYQKKYWVQFHSEGNKKSTDNYSLMAKKNVDEGKFQTEPIGPQPDPIFAGESVPDFTPGKPFNTGSSHANNLTPEEVDAYLTPLFSKKAISSVKLQPIEVKRAIAQLHFLTTVPTTEGAYKNKAKATEDYNALHTSIENQVKNTSYGSTASLHVDNPKPVTTWSYSKMQPNYKGAFEKFDVTDDTDTAYLFKPTKGGDPYRAEVAHYAHEVAHLFGYKTAQSHLLTVENKHGQKVYGQAQAKFDNATDLAGVKPEELTEKQILGVAAEHVLDWAINQDDTHSENLFVLPDGSIVGIDKDRAYAFFGSQELKRGKFQHKSVVEQQYYEAFYKAIADGKINPATVQKAYKVAMQNARRIEKVDDAKYREILEKAFANNKKLNDASRKQLIDDVIARKNNMSKDFDEFWTNIMDEAGIAKPDTKLPLAPGLYGGFSNPELMDDVKNGRNWGHSTFFAGQDIEDGHLLLWEEKGADGGPPVLYGQGHMLSSGDEKFKAWLKDNYNGPDSVSTADPNKTLKNKATYDEKIVRGIKDIRRQMSGKSASGGDPVVALSELRTEMQNYLNNSVYETDYPNMPKKQAAHQAMLEQYIGTIDAALKANDEGVKPEIFTPYNYVWQDEDKIDLEPVEKLGYKITKRSATLFVAKANADNTLTDTGTTSTTGQTGSEYVIELEDGTQIIYRPWEYNTSKSQQGQFRFRAAGHNGEITGKRVQDFLKEVGIEADDPDEEDLELQYWRSLYGILSNRSDKSYGKQANVVAAVNANDPRKLTNKSDELEAWRDAWSNMTSREQVDKFVADQGFLPQFMKTTLQDHENGHGRPYWNRFDVDINEIRLKNQFIARSQLTLGGGDSPGADAKVMMALMSGGVLPVEERARLTGYWKPGSNGGSGDADSRRGSGSFTMGRQNIENSSYHIYFDPAMLARTSTYTYTTDNFGDSDYKSSQAYFDTKKGGSHSGGSNEIVIKYGMSILSDAVLVVFYSAQERQKAIDSYKALGINNINGVPLEEVFITRENRSAGLKAAHARMKARVQGSGYDPNNSAFVANMPTTAGGSTIPVAAPKTGQLVASKAELDNAPAGTEVYDKGAPYLIFTKLPNGMWGDPDGDSYPSSQFSDDDGVVVSYKWGAVPKSGLVVSVDELKDAPEGAKVNNDGWIYTKTEPGPDGVWESPTGNEVSSQSFLSDIEEGHAVWVTEAANSAGLNAAEMGDTVTDWNALQDAPIGATVIINPPNAQPEHSAVYAPYVTVTKQANGLWTDVDGDYVQATDWPYYLGNSQVQWINPQGNEAGSAGPTVGSPVTAQQMDEVPPGATIKSTVTGTIFQKAGNDKWYDMESWDVTEQDADTINIEHFVWNGLSYEAAQMQQQNAQNDNPAIKEGYDVAEPEHLSQAPAGSVVGRYFQNGNVTEYTKTSDGQWEQQFTGTLFTPDQLWGTNHEMANPSYLQWKEIGEGEVDPDWEQKLLSSVPADDPWAQAAQELSSSLPGWTSNLGDEPF